MVDIAYVRGNVKEGWILNPNDKVISGIIKGINRNDGNCPCANDSEDKHCPCSNYRLHDKCCCHLYIKPKKESVGFIHPFSTEACADRLVNDYKKHGRIVIGYDFDNTIFDTHNSGGNFSQVIDLLVRATKMGNIMALYTAERDEEHLKWKINYAKSLGIGVDYVNQSPLLDGATVKPFFNILLDDRAGLESAYNSLRMALDKIDNEKSL